MKIGVVAFYKGTNLESVTVKAPEVEYAGDSVYNEDPKVTLHCYIDSTSVAYAKKYGIKYDTSLGKKTCSIKRNCKKYRWKLVLL